MVMACYHGDYQAIMEKLEKWGDMQIYPNNCSVE